MRTKEKAVEIARQIVKEKFPQADIAFCAGSIVRGEGTETSDIDLVVVFPRLDQAYRESFIFNGWLVEALVHDVETLRYFFYEVDRPSGCMALPQMVFEGAIVWGGEELGKSLKEEALEVQKMGLPPLSQEDIKNRIYGITDLVDDLKAPRSREEAVGIAVRLYDQLSDFALRSQGSWSGDGKQIPRALEKASRKLYERFTTAFESFFSRNETDKLFDLAEDLVREFGGFNFDGYHRAAPPEWRMKKHSNECEKSKHL